jgi:hypothetical protein
MKSSKIQKNPWSLRNIKHISQLRLRFFARKISYKNNLSLTRSLAAGMNRLLLVARPLARWQYECTFRLTSWDLNDRAF